MSAVPPISASALQPILQAAVQQLPMAAPAVDGGSFASFLTRSLRTMETKVAHADQMVKAFALDDNIPVHQVTYALEEARLSVELAMQVRTRLLEGYRELMNMQL
ncbi:MAG TPA: flagellar hook-basal body complex protein FliE [Sphingomicrobium sp.]|nr:flagellar hook-basal body complex protein FliE [Sphingomicrobium sp.]